MFSYCLLIAQQLSDVDKRSRTDFPCLFKKNVEKNPNFFGSIASSDECTFLLGSAVNDQNCCVWGRQRPDTVFESPKSTQSLMVWCTMSKSEVVGYYVFLTTAQLREKGSKRWYVIIINITFPSR